VADSSLTANANCDINVESVADVLPSPKDNCQMESAAAAVAVTLKVTERTQVKNVEVKSITWCGIKVGDGKSH
jgi:hypothetical protein